MQPVLAAALNGIVLLRCTPLIGGLGYNMALCKARTKLTLTRLLTMRTTLRRDVETSLNAGLTQLGECYPYKVEAMGSSPLPRTNSC